MLVGLDPPIRDWRMPVPARTTVGRDEGLGISISDERVSRLHAELILDPDGGLIARDLESANGTEVNGARITVPTRLERGDVISFAGVRFAVRDSGDPMPKNRPSVVAPSLVALSLAALALAGWALLARPSNSYPFPERAALVDVASGAALLAVPPGWTLRSDADSALLAKAGSGATMRLLRVARPRAQEVAERRRAAPELQARDAAIGGAAATRLSAPSVDGVVYVCDLPAGALVVEIRGSAADLEREEEALLSALHSIEVRR